MHAAGNPVFNLPTLEEWMAELTWVVSYYQDALLVHSDVVTTS